MPLLLRLGIALVADLVVPTAHSHYATITANVVPGDVGGIFGSQKKRQICDVVRLPNLASRVAFVKPCDPFWEHHRVTRDHLIDERCLDSAG